MDIKKNVIYAEIDGKACLIKSNAPAEAILSVISAFEVNKKVKAVPLKNHELGNLGLNQIDSDYVDLQNKG